MLQGEDLYNAAILLSVTQQAGTGDSVSTETTSARKGSTAAGGNMSGAEDSRQPEGIAVRLESGGETAPTPPSTAVSSDASNTRGNVRVPSSTAALLVIFTSLSAYCGISKMTSL